MKLFRRRFLYQVAGAAALPAVSRVARAQTYPTHRVRYIVSSPPGGAQNIVSPSVSACSAIDSGKNRVGYWTGRSAKIIEVGSNHAERRPSSWGGLPL